MTSPLIPLGIPRVIQLQWPPATVPFLRQLLVLKTLQSADTYVDDSSNEAMGPDCHTIYNIYMRMGNVFVKNGGRVLRIWLDKDYTFESHMLIFRL